MRWIDGSIFDGSVSTRLLNDATKRCVCVTHNKPGKLMYHLKPCNIARPFICQRKGELCSGL